MKNRIKQLRLARGFSLDDLAAHMGGLVTKQALSKYEKGEIQPSVSVLVRLTDALGTNVADLLRPQNFKISLLAFRKMASMGVKEQEWTKALIKTEFEKRLLLQERLPGNHKLEIPIAAYNVKNEVEADAAAEKLRNEMRLGVDPIGNLTALLENHAVHVLCLEASRKFDGFSAVAQDLAGTHISAAVVCRKDVSGDRQRLTLAHELAHLVLRSGNNAPAEKFAYRFGAAFLVPKEPLMREVGEKRTSINVNELLLLKARFGISVQALIRRMRDLEIISEPGYKSACILINRMGWRIKEPGAPILPEQSTWLERSALRAWSEGLISKSEVISFLGYVPNMASETSAIRRKEFLQLSKSQRDRILQEQAKSLEKHYAVASDWDTVETEEWQ